MLSHTQRRTTALCTAAAGLLIVVCGWWGTRPLPRLPLAANSIHFEGARAAELARALAQDFPQRITGTPGARRSAYYLRAQLMKAGYPVFLQPFPIWLEGEQVEGENLVGLEEGHARERVAIVAHYDSPSGSLVKSEDSAPAVGVLLELARALHQTRRRLGLIVAATDAGEWGMIGARELAGYLKQHHTIAVITIQCVRSKSHSLQLNCTGQFAGHTPLWLRQLLVASGQAQGSVVEQATGEEEWLDRALEISAQDQGPLLRAGIPAVNVGTISNSARFLPMADSGLDMAPAIDPAVLQRTGATVEQAVLALEGISPGNQAAPGAVHSSSSAPAGRPAPVTPAGAEAFQLSATRYVPGAYISAIQVLLLLPLLVAAFFAAHNFTAIDLDVRGWRFFEPLSWIIPPGLATLLLYVLTEVNALPRYELYPASPQDTSLYHVPFTVLAVLVGIMVAGWVEIGKLHTRVDSPAVPFAVQKEILYLWTTIAVLLAFFVNPYAMGVFLAGFGYGALLLLPPSGPLQRLWNAVFLLAGAAPFAVLAYSVIHHAHLGWHLVGYVVLQTAYGVWSAAAVALFLMSLALGIQLFGISVAKAQS